MLVIEKRALAFSAIKNVQLYYHTSKTIQMMKN